MARRRESGIEQVSSIPWPAGIILGLVVYVAVRHGIGWSLSDSSGPILATIGKHASTGGFAAIAWTLLGGCWIAALRAYLKRRKRRRLLDSQTGLDSLRSIHWREFEMLTGEAFRRQGYAIEETGLGGADGGIDLILRKDGRTTLVQCKQWKNRQVSVNVVREMAGLLAHHGANAVKIVALGDYTPDARNFAQGKPIELVDGAALLDTVRKVRAVKASAPTLLDQPAAFAGAIAAGLGLIYALSPSERQNAPAVIATPPVVMPATLPAPPPRIMPVTRAMPVSQTMPPAPRVQSYGKVPQTDAELREWERRNAEAMKILEKTTPEVQRR